MLYLAVDPGITTGVCLAYWSKTYSQAVVIRKCFIDILDSAPWDRAWPAIQNLMSLCSSIYTIVERSPIKGEVDQLEKVSAIIGLAQFQMIKSGNENVKLCVLSPGDWKPIAKARHWHHPSARNAHEADAFNLLRYYGWRTHHIELPYLQVAQPRRSL